MINLSFHGRRFAGGILARMRALILIYATKRGISKRIVTVASVGLRLIWPH